MVGELVMLIIDFSASWANVLAHIPCMRVVLFGSRGIIRRRSCACADAQGAESFWRTAVGTDL